MSEEKQTATSDFMNWLRAASATPAPRNPLFDFAVNHTQEEVDRKLDQLAKAFAGFSARAPAIGDEMDDGTILAGYYKGKPVYATPQDAPLTYTFNEAADYARQLNAQKFLGHDDWRAPSQGELDVLWENRNQGKLAGTFNEAAWYWSSTPSYDFNGWAQRFSDGSPTFHYINVLSSLRCVR
jgi:hypothetical protein